MKLLQKQGRAVIIGGSEDKKGECKILREFINLAGADKSRIVVMTVATDKVEEVAAEYVETFRRLGVDDVDAVDVSSREQASAPPAIDLIRKSTGIFFTGGDQPHITSLLGGSEIDQVLHERYEAGVVLAGTSAGASMLANSMITEGDSDTNPRLGAIQMAPAMEFVPGILVDVHFSQRGRIGRLLTAVAHYPHDIGVGIDEDTAVVVTDDEFRVVGSGAATVVDATAADYTNLPYLKRNESLTLCGIRLHILTDGYRYNVRDQTPLVGKGASRGSQELTAGKSRNGSKRFQGKKVSKTHRLPPKQPQEVRA
jgi:cyanophycinase